jgi:hypothetical protein
MAQQFTIDLDHQPDALAGLLEALASRHVDLRTIAVTGIGRRTTAVLITNDDAVTREILRTHHVRYSAGDVVITSVPDEPGALAHVMHQIAQAGIDLQGLSLLRWHQGKAELALSTDNPAALHQVLLGGYHLPGSARWCSTCSTPGRWPTASSTRGRSSGSNGPVRRTRPSRATTDRPQAGS